MLQPSYFLAPMHATPRLSMNLPSLHSYLAFPKVFTHATCHDGSAIPALLWIQHQQICCKLQVLYAAAQRETSAIAYSNSNDTRGAFISHRAVKQAIRKFVSIVLMTRRTCLYGFLSYPVRKLNIFSQYDEHLNFGPNDKIRRYRTN